MSVHLIYSFHMVNVWPVSVFCCCYCYLQQMTTNICDIKKKKLTFEEPKLLFAVIDMPELLKYQFFITENCKLYEDYIKYKNINLSVSAMRSRKLSVIVSVEIFHIVHQ